MRQFPSMQLVSLPVRAETVYYDEPAVESVRRSSESVNSKVNANSQTAGRSLTSDVQIRFNP